MTKVIESPVKHFTGKVHLHEPLTMPMVIELEKCSGFLVQKDDKYTLKDDMTWAQYDYAWLGAILPCVEKWELENFPDEVTQDSFPATPRTQSRALVDWLIGELLEIYSGEKEVPNE